ncbi:hypothetical protein FPSE_07694 [Fusarium pseudograminearum CS3096]|uniref:Uncharacterized protein n=1 Tax=Fusarium pseudograminearum (strain CS3096) TaxID=1028729 RepID=K3UJL6_FUSPC|nr:hypothetical protein FPSE_07694 [Fusarium pseudograminearum CS3096]EKJ72156.1 hypothetical protein FPSE_07694 [Fusarium pseudograminearum CS3096]
MCLYNIDRYVIRDDEKWNNRSDKDKRSASPHAIMLAENLADMEVLVSPEGTDKMRLL